MTSSATQPARQREYASIPDLVAGHYAHPTVTAQDADRLWRDHGTDYHVSGDQSLREHGRRGLRLAGRPGSALVRASRLGHRQVTVAGSLAFFLGNVEAGIYGGRPN